MTVKAIKKNFGLLGILLLAIGFGDHCMASDVELPDDIVFFTFDDLPKKTQSAPSSLQMPKRSDPIAIPVRGKLTPTPSSSFYSSEEPDIPVGSYRLPKVSVLETIARLSQSQGDIIRSLFDDSDD